MRGAVLRQGTKRSPSCLRTTLAEMHWRRVRHLAIAAIAFRHRGLLALAASAYPGRGLAAEGRRPFVLAGAPLHAADCHNTTCAYSSVLMRCGKFWTGKVDCAGLPSRAHTESPCPT